MRKDAISFGFPIRRPLVSRLEPFFLAGRSGFCYPALVRRTLFPLCAALFACALSAHAAPSVTIDPSTTSPEITIPLDLTVHGGETLVLTVAALPQDLTNLTAYFTVNGEEHALPLVDQAGNPLTISAFQNVTITADGILDAEGLFTVSIEGQDVDNYDLSI